MSDVDQLAETIRKMGLIHKDIAIMQETPIHQRDDLWYRIIGRLARDWDELEDARTKLIGRIHQGEEFAAWLKSRWLN